MREHHKDKQHTRGDRRGLGQIDGDHLHYMIAKKRAPRLRWRPAIALPAILARSCGEDLETHFRQLSPNPWAVPRRIGLPHTANQFDKFRPPDIATVKIAVFYSFWRTGDRKVEANARLLGELLERLRRRARRQIEVAPRAFRGPDGREQDQDRDGEGGAKQ
jgi:hypothetical protein